jgi:hypothetical protein
MAWDWKRLIEADEDKKAEEKDEEPEKTKLEDINMESFVSDVMRLVENYDSLLEIKNTVLRRAANYLSQNYEGDVLQVFKNSVMTDSNIVENNESNDSKNVCKADSRHCWELQHRNNSEPIVYQDKCKKGE